MAQKLCSVSNFAVKRLFATTTTFSGTNMLKPDEKLETKKARLIYQSRKRGILEMDILLGSFSEEKLNSLNPQQVDTYDHLINGGHNEWDIWYWVSGTQPTPESVDTDVMKMLKQFALTSNKMAPYKISKN